MNKKIREEMLQDIVENKKRHEKEYKKIKENVDQSSAYYHGHPVNFLYHTILVDQDNVSMIKDKLHKLNQILKEVTARYLEDPEFRSFFRFPKLMEELILIDPGYEIEYPVARFDFFNPYQEDNFKFCELNTDGTSAMNEVRVLQRDFSDSPLITDLETDYNFNGFELFHSLIDDILANYRQYCGKDEINPNIAIVDFEGDGTINEFKEFKKRFEERGYKTVICDPREMEYTAGELYYNDMKIDLIYRRATTNRVVEEGDKIDGFLQAYRDGAVCVVGGFRSQIPHNKIIFSILHDRDKVDFLSERQHQFIEQHIPWTAVFDSSDKELIDKLKQNKDDYLLKPTDLNAGQGVYIGRDHSGKEWEEILFNLEDDHYLAQEFIEVPQLEMPVYEEGELRIDNFNYIMGIFQYNQELAGLYCRAGRENIIAPTGESFTVPVFTIEDRD